MYIVDQSRRTLHYIRPSLLSQISLEKLLNTLSITSSPIIADQVHHNRNHTILSMNIGEYHGWIQLDNGIVYHVVEDLIINRTDTDIYPPILGCVYSHNLIVFLDERKTLYHHLIAPFTNQEQQNSQYNNIAQLQQVFYHESLQPSSIKTICGPLEKSALLTIYGLSIWDGTAYKKVPNKFSNIETVVCANNSEFLTVHTNVYTCGVRSVPFSMPIVGVGFVHYNKNVIETVQVNKVEQPDNIGLEYDLSSYTFSPGIDQPVYNEWTLPMQ